MLKIKLSKHAQSFLRNLPVKHAKQILAKIDKLSADPASLPSKPLTGFPHYRRAKSGEYRIIYRIDEGVLLLLVVLIGKRNDSDVYRDFERIVGGNTTNIDGE